MSRTIESSSTAPLDSVDGIVASFRERDYVCDRSLATAVFLGLRLGRPLLLEGEGLGHDAAIARSRAALGASVPAPRATGRVAV